MRSMRIRSQEWFLSAPEIQSTKTPTLIMMGDHDQYNLVPKMVDLFHLLPHGETAVIPGCGHVVLDCKEQFTITAVETFLDQRP
jgi:pimeloyl-ACP methyl ester carboxylesterase